MIVFGKWRSYWIFLFLESDAKYADVGVLSLFPLFLKVLMLFSHVFRHNFAWHDVELKRFRRFAKNRETVEKPWVVDALVLAIHDPLSYCLSEKL